MPFAPDDDYASYVDGRPRADGVRAFLESRHISLPEGQPDDPPDAATVNGLGNRKNDLRPGHDPRPTASALRRIGPLPGGGAAAGLRRAVVSASANCRRRAACRRHRDASSRSASTAPSRPSGTWPASRPPTPTWRPPGPGRHGRAGRGVRGRPRRGRVPGAAGRFGCSDRRRPGRPGRCPARHGRRRWWSADLAEPRCGPPRADG